MKVKKNPKYKLENYSKVFLQLGLVVALFIIYILFENRTLLEQQNDGGDNSKAVAEEYLMDFQEIQEEQPEEEQQPEEKKPKVEVEEVKEVEDDKKIEEAVFNNDDEKDPEPIDDDFDEPVEKPKPKIVETVSFVKIEEAPIFPGCEGEPTKAARKKCLQKKITRHVNNNFNADLANELGLSSGRKRIMVQFKINQEGKVTNIQSVAPHPQLKKEAERIIRKLPRMKPGMQRNTPVIVKYALPIQFVVE